MNNNLTNPADQSWAKIIQEIGRKQLANLPEVDDFDLLRVSEEELIGTKTDD
jgi:hypothetical protein